MRIESPKGVEPETFADDLETYQQSGSIPPQYADEGLDTFKRAAMVYRDIRGPALCIPARASGCWWFCGLA